MTNTQKIDELRNHISSTLNPLIDRNYWLLEVPYYTNIGDTLIWQGTLDYLKTLPYKCRGMYSLHSFRYPRIPENDLILFQGGGNFGDLWTWSHDFRMKVIAQYPRNRYILLPQTVYFENLVNLKRTAEFYAKYPQVTICARDKDSYIVLKEHFKNEILLVPDMAFWLNTSCWNMNVTNTHKSLLLKRTDIELKDNPLYAEIGQKGKVDIADWPTMMNADIHTRILMKIQSHPRLLHCLQDIYAKYVYRKHLIHSGINLFNHYDTIYTTRLHGMILGVLMNKNIIVIDNSYGKNSCYYHTWLEDCDNVTLLS